MRVSTPPQPRHRRAISKVFICRSHLAVLGAAAVFASCTPAPATTTTTTTTTAAVTTTTTSAVTPPISAPTLSSISLTAGASNTTSAKVVFKTTAAGATVSEVWFAPAGGTWARLATASSTTSITATIPATSKGQLGAIAVRSVPAGKSSCIPDPGCSTIAANQVSLRVEVPTMTSAVAAPESLTAGWAALGTSPFASLQLSYAPNGGAWTNVGAAITTPVAGQRTIYSLPPGVRHTLKLTSTQRSSPLITASTTRVTSTLGWDPYTADNFAGASIAQRPAPASGTVLWVSPTGAGTTCAQATPCSLSTAKSKLVAGATVVVKGGTYEQASFGVIDKPVTLMAEPNTVPVLKGSATVTGAWQRVSSAASVWSRNDLAHGWPAIPSWAKLAGQTTTVNPEADDPEQIIVDGAYLQQVDATQWGPSAGKFYRDATNGATPLPVGRFYYDASVSPAVVYLASANDPATRKIEWSKVQRALKLGPNAAGSVVRGLTFLNYSPYHGNALAAVEVIAQNVTLEDVSVKYSAATGIAAVGHNSELTGAIAGLVLRRVTATDNGALGAALGDASPTATIAQGHENDMVIEFSRFDRNNREKFNYETCNAAGSCVLAGVKIARVDGLLLRYSSFKQNNAAGFWADLYCQNAVIVGNSFRSNVRSGVFYEVSRAATISSNVFAGNNTSGASSGAGIKITGAGTNSPDAPGTGGVLLDRNTFAANVNAQVILGYDVRPSSEGNIGWQIGKPQALMHGNLFAEGAQGTPSAGRAVIRTIVGDVANLDATWVGATNTGANHFVVRDALDSSDITRYVWGSKRYATIAAFATAVGTETGSTMTVRAITDPSAGLFVNPAAGNFRTRAVSEPTTSIRGAASGSWATAPISEMARVALGLSTTNPAGTGAIFATTTPA